MPRDSNLAETVELLDNVAGKEAPNQRALAAKIGISVGLVNALVHRAVRKGLIKIKEVPARRYAYYLTPKGLAEKSKLVAEYLDYSLTFFRIARQEYSDVFGALRGSGKEARRFVRRRRTCRDCVPRRQRHRYCARRGPRSRDQPFARGGAARNPRCQ